MIRRVKNKIGHPFLYLGVSREVTISGSDGDDVGILCGLNVPLMIANIHRAFGTDA